MTRRSIILLTLFVAGIVTIALIAMIAPAANAAEWRAEVDPWVLQTAAENGETEFLVFLSDQADLSAAIALITKLEKGTFVYDTLTEKAARTQAPVIAALEARGAEYRSYWVANMIWVRGDLASVQAMAERNDVSHIYANPTVQFEPPTVEEGIESPQAIEWNITKVNADDVWNMGYTGQGTVIGGQDTGYDWDHPALKNQYRGWNGTTADHNYSWHDSIHSGGGSCGSNSSEPCDDSSHGTHTMGTMVGDDGGSNQIGMAPGARWIGCRNMDQGNGTPTTYSECYQWFIAPTDLNDQNPDPSMAPHAINNSWSCPVSEGCTDPNVMLAVVDNVRAAGILTAHAASNAGSSCSSVNTPAGIYDSSYTVGATNSSDGIAGFSSRGPVSVDGSGRLKPDISAPGVSIRSSVPGGGYASGWSGTSMAAPHVAGMTALLISANPALAGQVDQLENITNLSAVPRTTTQICGGVPGDQIPNNTYGYGRIDVLAAVNSMDSYSADLTKTASAGIISPGELLSYTLEITNTSTISDLTNVVLTDTIPTQTVFYTATGPYTQMGGYIEWSIGTLTPNEHISMTLTVMVSATASGTIVNEYYGMSSDQLNVSGSPVATVVQGPNYQPIYLPLILKE